LVSPERRVRLERRTALTVVLLGALVIGLWHPGERGPFWQGIEGRLLDARFLLRGPLPAPQQVAIVAFDDAAIAQGASFPPSRTALGAAVTDAWAAGARALALDFLMVDPRRDDAGLASALARGPVILAVAEAASSSVASALHTRSGLALVTGPAPLPTQPPLPALGPAPLLQDAAGLGHVTVQHGPDGALRRMRPALALTTPSGVVQVAGLAVAAVATQAGPARYLLNADGIGGRLQIGTISLPLDLRGTLALDFYGPAGSIPTYSAASVTSADLRGKIVFLGATATGFGDRHASPFDATLPGVELHATFAANLLAQRFLRRDVVAWSASVSLGVLAAVLGFMAAGLGRPGAAAGATGLAALATAGALQAAFGAGWWLDASAALLSLAFGVAVGVGLQQFNQRRRATNLARYQSPALVEALATTADPLQHRPPQAAVVLFVDVAGFTPYAERSGPQGTHAFLALFTLLVEQAANQCNGLIADFAGDGALVVFGVPQPGADDVERALQFIEQLYDSVRDCADWPGLGLRVSGHAGLVQLGVLGGDRHRRVSVSGDVVNTASRLQECARSRNASLALSGAIVTAAPAARRWADRAGLTPMARQPLRGRAALEEVWVGEPPGGRAGPAAAP
jgi:adenylate cyclase